MVDSPSVLETQLLLLTTEDLLEMVGIEESLSLDDLALLIPAAVPRVVLVIRDTAPGFCVDSLHLDDGPAILADDNALLATGDFELVARVGEEQVDVGPGGVVVVGLVFPCTGEAMLAGDLPVDVVVDVVEELLGALGRVVEEAEDFVNVLAVGVNHCDLR